MCGTRNKLPVRFGDRNENRSYNVKESHLTENGRAAPHSVSDANLPRLVNRETTSYHIILGMIILVSGVFRLRNLDTLPPFIDETAMLKAIIDPGIFPDLWRVVTGDFLGLLLFKPIYYVCYDPLYCARLVMALIGIASTAVMAAIALKLGGRIASIVCCAVVGFSPLLVFHDRIALWEQLAFLLTCVAILLNVIAFKSGRPAFTFWGALVFVLACSTKVYFVLLAPLLFLPDLFDGFSWEAIRRKAVLVLAGCVAGTAILAMLMASILAELHVAQSRPGGLASYFGADRQMLFPPEGSHSTRLHILLTGLHYVGGVLLKYQGRSFWLLYAASIFALFGRRKSLPSVFLLAMTLMAALAICAVLVNIFPRYLNVIMLPIALQIGLAAEQVLARYFLPSEKPLTVRFRANPLYALQGGLFIFFGVGTFLNTARNDFLIMYNQRGYRNIPLVDHWQYQASYSSGARIAETVDFIRNYCLEAGEPVVLWTVGGLTHGNATFPLLLRGQGNLQFVHDFTIQPDRLGKIIDSKTRVLLLIEPIGGPVNYKELPKLGFTLTSIYSSPALSGGKYEIVLVEKKVSDTVTD